MARFRHHRWPLLTSLLLLIALSGFTACSTQLTTFEPRSDAAERTHAIYILLVVLASLIGAGVLAAMVYIMIRFRAKPGRQASQTHGNTTIEIIWTIIPAGILLLIGVPSVLALIQAHREPADDALRIEVTGHQWWWEVEYAGLGPDGGPLVTANEIHIPVGVEIAIELESVDVIHSFWVPQLVGKMDAIPGRTTKLEPFTAKEVGVFFGQCTEFCGTAHAMMRFRVIVEPLADFERWMDALQEPPGQTTGLASQGQQLFTSSGCTVCHAIAGTVAQGTVGPNLTRFGSRLTVGAGLLENTDENVSDWIFDLRAIKPVPDDGGVRFMPSFGTLPRDSLPFPNLTEGEVHAITAYLRGMRVE
jgi:cytochrome c oxidase subunit 2